MGSESSKQVKQPEAPSARFGPGTITGLILLTTLFGACLASVLAVFLIWAPSSNTFKGLEWLAGGALIGLMIGLLIAFVTVYRRAVCSGETTTESIDLSKYTRQ